MSDHAEKSYMFPVKMFLSLVSVETDYQVVYSRKSYCQSTEAGTVKPVYNDHLYNKIYCLWFIQQCVLMKTEGTNSLLLTISAFWSSSRWPLAT